MRSSIARFRGQALAASALVLVLGLEAQAASLGVNLVRNGSFEDVIASPIGDYGSLGVADWAPGFPVAAAYNYSTGYSAGLPSQVDTTVDEGDFFYWGGGTGASFTISQTIDVSSGDVATAIGLGIAEYTLSGFFSSYSSQGDHATITATFRDGSGTSLGMSSGVGGADAITNTDPFGFALWGFESAAGTIPVGTQSVFVNIVSTRLGGGYNDAYVDLVNLTVNATLPPTAVPLPGALFFAAPAFAALGFVRRRV